MEIQDPSSGWEGRTEKRSQAEPTGWDFNLGRERSLHTRHHAKPNVNQPELPVGWTRTKETVLNVDTISAEG